LTINIFHGNLTLSTKVFPIIISTNSILTWISNKFSWLIPHLFAYYIGSLRIELSITHCHPLSLIDFHSSYSTHCWRSILINHSYSSFIWFLRSIEVNVATFNNYIIHMSTVLCHFPITICYFLLCSFTLYSHKMYWLWFISTIILTLKCTTEITASFCTRWIF
jgi:hypothetical protein